VKPVLFPLDIYMFPARRSLTEVGIQGFEGGVRYQSNCHLVWEETSKVFFWSYRGLLVHIAIV
jgi:hypothetical protein